MAKKDSEYIYLKRHEVDIITSTPPSECWMCTEIYNHLRNTPHNKRWLRISLKWLEDNDMLDHLEQIIGELDSLEVLNMDLERVC